MFEPDHTALKLKVFWADYNALADGPLVECPNNTNLAALTAVQKATGL